MAVSEWDHRQLCPDGGCVGVIGPDGTCKVCGRVAPNWGDERKRGLLEPEEASGDDDGENEAEDEDELEDEGEAEDEREGEGDAAAAAPHTGWTARRLCPDGGCIGVIDESGRCKVCDRAAPDVPPAAPEAVAAAGDPESTSGDPGPVAGAAPAAGERERCADIGCSGTIGASGRCEVCGKGAS